MTKVVLTRAAIVLLGGVVGAWISGNPSGGAVGAIFTFMVIWVCFEV